MTIHKCPTCGSKRIRRRVIDLELTVRDKTRIVPSVELEVCPDCGEKLFDIAAMNKVEELFPPRRGARPRKARPRS